MPYIAEEASDWYPVMYEGVHVRHLSCGGWLYQRYYTRTGVPIGPVQCERCNPGFLEEQLNLFDWNVYGRNS